MCQIVIFLRPDTGPIAATVVDGRLHGRAWQTHCTHHAYVVKRKVQQTSKLVLLSMGRQYTIHDRPLRGVLEAAHTAGDVRALAGTTAASRRRQEVGVELG